MRLLADTHALLWLAGDSARLSAAALDALTDIRNDVAVSAISAHEIATKYRLGRLPSAQGLIHDYRAVLAGLGLADLPVSATHASLAGLLDWANRDPFDRIIAAQAMSDGRRLVTKDVAFATLPGIQTLW